MSNAGSHDASGGKPARHGEPTAARPDPSLLEKVLERALSGPESDQDAQALHALREVARHHRGQPLALEPVVVHLVEAVLRLQVPQPAGDRRTTAATLAQTLWDDADARKRLERLWTQLNQPSP